MHDEIVHDARDAEIIQKLGAEIAPLRRWRYDLRHNDRAWRDYAVARYALSQFTSASGSKTVSSSTITCKLSTKASQARPFSLMALLNAAVIANFVFARSARSGAIASTSPAI